MQIPGLHSSNPQDRHQTDVHAARRGLRAVFFPRGLHMDPEPTPLQV